MPTSTGQSVLVYALNVLLLLNLTVIVVLLTGAPPAPAERVEAPVPEPIVVADEAVETAEPAPVVPVRPERPVVVEAIAEPTPVIAVSPEPFVLATPAEDQPATEQEPLPQVAPQPVEPPAEFFGVGLD